MEKLFVGIDPGLNGAVALLGMASGFLGVWDTPTITVRSSGKNRNKYQTAQMVSILDAVKGYGGEIVVVGMELVNAMPGQGVTSMFGLGKGCGLWEGITSALQMPLSFVTPQVWKKALLGAGVGSDKSASLLRAQALFPKAAPQLSRKKDDGRADAILIAEFFRRKGSA